MKIIRFDRLSSGSASEARSRMVFALAFALALGAHSALADEVSDPGIERPTVEQDFRFHCAACHGVNGKGEGPVSRVLKIEPPDLTRIAERSGGVFPEAMVFETISGTNMPTSHGTREMPLWGDLFIGEILEGSASVKGEQEAATEATNRIKRLVAYIATLQVRDNR
jgi:mono/diheme cytochrome c family protein